MAVTYSTNGNIFKASAEGDVIPAKFYKALFWYCTGATAGTTLMMLTEKDTDGHLVYPDVAEQTDFCKPIPMPNGAVEGLYVKDLDGGYIFGFIDKP